MPIKMKSLKAHRYGTRMMAAGDEYDVPGESAARVVEALKWSKRAPVVAPAPVAPPAPAPKKWTRKPVEVKIEPLADTAPTVVGTPTPPEDKPAEPGFVRRYTRRDPTPSED